MSKVTQFADASGRVHVRVEEGATLSFITPPTQPVKSATFTEVIRAELKTPEGERPVSHGQVVVSAGISPGSITAALVMEINLIGYAGSIPCLIDRGCLSAASPIRRFRFDDVEPYTSIGLEARQIVDGQPDISTLPSQFNVQLLGLFWS